MSIQAAIADGGIMTKFLKNKLPFSFEEEFGEIRRSMTNYVNNKVQIVDYKKCDIQFISTLGLSNLNIFNTQKAEWFMEFDGALASENAASMMDYYVSMLIEGHIPFPKRGNFILFPDQRDHIWPNDNTCGIYFTLPAYRSEEFDINMEKIGILTIWVVPITISDKDIIENKGWEYLEDYWDNNNTDLHNPFRK
ncbi:MULTISPECIES: suppressor of fused domain protein [Acetobacter]|uniref:suppressor of fused domain protein n=1 Tax=Acetobacter TaxID=434 RepID=UPI00377050B6